MNVQDLINYLNQFSGTEEVLINDNNLTINDGYVTGQHFTIDSVNYRKVVAGIDIDPSDPDYADATTYVCIVSSNLPKK